MDYIDTNPSAVLVHSHILEWPCYGYADYWRRGGTTSVCYSHCYAMDYSDSNIGVCRNNGVLVIVGTVWALVICHLKSWHRANLHDLVLKK